MDEPRQDPGHQLIRDIVCAELRRGLESENFVERVREVVREERRETKGSTTWTPEMEAQWQQLLRNPRFIPVPDDTNKRDLLRATESERDAYRAQRDNAVRRAEDAEASEAGLREQLDRTEQDLRIAKLAAAPSREHFDRSREFGQEVEKLRDQRDKAREYKDLIERSLARVVTERDALRNRLDGLDADDTPAGPGGPRRGSGEGGGTAEAAGCRPRRGQGGLRPAGLGPARRGPAPVQPGACHPRSGRGAEQRPLLRGQRAKAMRNERDKALEQQAVEAERVAMREALANREFGEEVEKLLKERDAMKAGALAEQDAMKELAEHCRATSCVPEKVCMELRHECDRLRTENECLQASLDHVYKTGDTSGDDPVKTYPDPADADPLPDPDETGEEREARYETYRLVTTGQSWDWAKARMMAAEKVRFRTWDPALYVRQPLRMGPYHQVRKGEGEINPNWRPTLYEANTPGWEVFEEPKQEDAK